MYTLPKPCFLLLKYMSCIFLLIIMQRAVAQLSQKQIEEQLTNGVKRSWQFNSYKKTLGSDCHGNWQLYTFYKGGKVQRKRCVEGKTEFIETTWKITPVNKSAEGEWQLTLSQPIELGQGTSLQTMRIDLPLAEIKKKGKNMIWRSVPECKSCEEQIVKLSSID
jgi:hypothetical protein